MIATLVTPPPAGAVLLLSTGPGSALSQFEPGKTATGSGAVTATDTSPSWTLQVEDQGSGAGKMVAAATGCGGSDPMLANPLQLEVMSPPSGVTSAGQISLSNSNQTIASSTSQVLTSQVFTVDYSQLLPPDETMLAGCVYSITVTYTLQ